MLKLKKAGGFTFTELMVALTLNALLFAALLTIFLANINHYRKVVNTNRLNHQLQTAMDLMVSDIRRAGYWANASSDINGVQNQNPFMAAGTDISINGAGDCILLSFDRNDDGSLPGISAAIDDERYGYRLMGNSLQGRPPGADFSCSAASNNWENLTDPKFVTLTNLSFVLNTTTLTTGPGSKGIYLRSIDISLTGQLTGDSSITRTLTQHVRIRNDKFFP